MLKRCLVALVLALVGAGVVDAQKRIPVRVHDTNVAPPPQNQEFVQITVPTNALTFATTDSTISLSATATAGITSMTWSNAATGGSGDMTLANGLWTATSTSSSIVGSDDFTESTTVQLYNHTPTPNGGGTWSEHFANTTVNCNDSSSDYVSPGALDANGGTRLICEFTPTGSVSGTNYNLKLKLASTFTNGGSNATLGLIFGITGTSGTDYCAALIKSTTTFTVVKTVAGVSTALGSTPITIAAAAGQEWIVERRGDDYTITQDGVTRATFTDSACSGSTRVGIGFGSLRIGTNGEIRTQARVDDFVLEDPDAGATAGVPVNSGSNIITVTGYEADMTPHTDTLTVTRGASDTTFPSGTITSPAAAGQTFNTSAATQIISGSYGDNVGVSSVSVACAECTPTSDTPGLVPDSQGATTGTWTTAAFTLASGNNHVIVTITDTSSNATVLPTLIVNQVTASDTTDPVVTVTQASTGQSASCVADTDGASTMTITSACLGGTATDNVSVSSVTYTSDTCGSGTASSGTGPSVAWQILLNLTQSCTVTVTAHDSSGLASATDSHTFTLLLPLTITTTSLPPGKQNTAYVDQNIIATGGTSPYTFSNNGAGTSLNDSDAQCAGLVISSAGVVNGTPTQTGDCTWVAKVTDNVAATDTQTITITIGSATLGGTNHDLFNQVCNGTSGTYSSFNAYKLRCETMRDATRLIQSTSTGGLGANSAYWTYGVNGPHDSGADADVHAQDGSKLTVPAWACCVKLATAISDAPAAGTIQRIAITGKPNSDWGNGMAVKFDDEVLQCAPPVGASTTSCLTATFNGETADTTHPWVMRGSFNTTPAAHATSSSGSCAGSYPGNITATGCGFVPQNGAPAGTSPSVPLESDSSVSKTYFVMTDIYFTQSYYNYGKFTSNAGMYGYAGPSTAYAQQSSNYKCFQIKAPAIWWEMQCFFSANGTSTEPANWDTDFALGADTTGAAIAGAQIRSYSPAGKSTLQGSPYTGTNATVTPVDNGGFDFRANTWSRVAYYIEAYANDDVNGFVNEAHLKTSLTNSSADTTVVIDQTGITGPPIYFWGNEKYNGRSIRIGTEIMTITTCGNATVNGPADLTCTVTRGAYGTAIAAHTAADVVQVTMDRISMWILDEGRGPTKIYDRVPVKRGYDTTTLQMYPMARFYYEMNTSSTNTSAGRVERSFVDLVLYVRDYISLVNPPANYTDLLVRPTAGGN